MANPTDIWSARRRIIAPRVAAVLYGVIAIVTADLVLQPDRLTYAQAAIGALLIGLVMTATHFFVKFVTKESEIGAHLRLAEAGAIAYDSIFVMFFPIITILAITVASLVVMPSRLLLDSILYLGIAAVFAVGFLSRYTLDREIRPALTRGLLWTLLILVLLGAKTVDLMY
jgi:hypothetical protein